MFNTKRPPSYFLVTLFARCCYTTFLILFLVVIVWGNIRKRPGTFALGRFIGFQSVVFSLLLQSAFYIFFFTVLYRDLLPYVVDVEVAHGCACVTFCFIVRHVAALCSVAIYRCSYEMLHLDACYLCLRSVICFFVHIALLLFGLFT